MPAMLVIALYRDGRATRVGALAISPGSGVPIPTSPCRVSYIRMLHAESSRAVECAMSEQKYKLIRVDERHHNGDSGLDLPRYRVLAVRTIILPDGKVIHPGEFGGFVDGEGCLSHNGNCWVGDQARAYGRSTVRDDALVLGRSVLGNPDSTLEGAHVSGRAVVTGFATVADSSIEDDARVDDCAEVRGGSTVGERARITGSARMHFSTAYDNAHIGGKAELSDSSVWGRAFVLGNARVDNCNVKDRALVMDFARAKNVDLVGDTILSEFASAVAEPDTPRRGGRAVEGQFSGTADALEPEQDSAPRRRSEGQTLIVPPDDLEAMLPDILASGPIVIKDESYLPQRQEPPDTGLDPQALNRAQAQPRGPSNECGAKTSSGERCTQSVGPHAEACRAGHKVAGQRA